MLLSRVYSDMSGDIYPDMHAYVCVMRSILKIFKSGLRSEAYDVVDRGTSRVSRRRSIKSLPKPVDVLDISWDVSWCCIVSNRYVFSFTALAMLMFGKSERGLNQIVVMSPACICSIQGLFSVGWWVVVVVVLQCTLTVMQPTHGNLGISNSASAITGTGGSTEAVSRGTYLIH